ncbi:DNA-directed primase/polymerase protein isoform X2 [Amia ocellicauda]|uniref:DNA-directed primase/polymerase protein isoform X2 n=1 Tax=Amia ocellicauda TaxID=2972642 RepID=UPI003463CF81
MIRTKWAEKVKRVEHLAQWYQQWPLSSLYKPRLSMPWQPSSVWRVFPRQTLAFSFTKSCKEDVRVFALEIDPAEMGQRIYLVTTYTELWHYYRTYRQSLMHCYEVIPEGAVCKLYFDLEFHKPSNKGLDGKQMVASLTQYVRQKLQEDYGIQCSDKDVLNLDSSTDEKFSRHLIFLLPNAAFKDNVQAGHFINKILQPALEELQRRRNHELTDGAPKQKDCPINSTNDRPPLSPVENVQKPDADIQKSPQPKRKRNGDLQATSSNQADLAFLFVKDKNGRDQLFIDLGVYTKNRNFRLYKSSKAGKNVAFTVAEDNRFVPKAHQRVSEEQQVFLSSIVSNVRFSENLRILTCDTAEAKKAQNPPSSLLPACKSALVTGALNSPYTEVDNFVLSLVKKDGIQGSIRQWNYFSSEELLVYDIVKFRWCHNVDRFHKSNNIMFVVDLKQELWYQKCHDPVCRAENYRSPSFPLPREVCLSYLMQEVCCGHSL